MNACLLRDETFWLWTNEGQDDQCVDVGRGSGVKIIAQCGGSYLLLDEITGFRKWLEKQYLELIPSNARVRDDEIVRSKKTLKIPEIPHKKIDPKSPLARYCW